MNRILISLPDQLLNQVNSTAKVLGMTRSEYIRDLLRKQGQPEIPLSPSSLSQRVEEPKVKPSPVDELGQAKEKMVRGIDKIAKVIAKQKKAPLFCPKHKGQLVGDRYSCGCGL